MNLVVKSTIILCFINLSTANLCGKPILSNKSNKQHFPWIAEIYSTINKTKEGNFQHLCGSSIIKSSFALTAAHCIQAKNSIHKRQPNEIVLYASVIDLKDFSDSNIIEIKEIFVHPSWSPKVERFEGDISILKFKHPVTFNEYISPICLWNWQNNEIISIDFGTIISFVALEKDDPGYYNYHHFDPINNFPKEYKMPIRESCTKTQKRFKPIISEYSFCAGGLNSGPCLETGSSGSSMAIEFNQIFYLRGIVSASFIDFAGCDNYTFTLFTDVLKYQDWIDGIAE